ncbi:hypothetical protein WJX77_007232 [Trebouxia sp. C0004]
MTFHVSTVKESQQGLYAPATFLFFSCVMAGFLFVWLVIPALQAGQRVTQGAVQPGCCDLFGLCASISCCLDVWAVSLIAPPWAHTVEAHPTKTFLHTLDSETSRCGKLPCKKADQVVTSPAPPEAGIPADPMEDVSFVIDSRPKKKGFFAMVGGKVPLLINHPPSIK